MTNLHNPSDSQLYDALAKATLQINQIMSNFEVFTGAHISGVEFRSSKKHELFIADDTEPIDTQYIPPCISFNISLNPKP